MTRLLGLPSAVLVLCAFLLASAHHTAAAPAAENITLGVREVVDPNRGRLLVFTGVVSNPEPRQDVEIVGQDCGTRGTRLIAATQTSPGGAYQVESSLVSSPYPATPLPSGIIFRARWNGQISLPVQYRQPARLLAAKVRGRAAWKVHFTPPELRVRYAGKPVVLQRRSGGRWVRFQTARLKLKPSLRYGPFNHEAVFDVPRRGLQLRGYLPAKSAAPCWLANSTNPWRT